MAKKRAYNPTNELENVTIGSSSSLLSSLNTEKQTTSKSNNYNDRESNYNERDKENNNKSDRDSDSGSDKNILYECSCSSYNCFISKSLLDSSKLLRCTNNSCNEDSDMLFIPECTEYDSNDKLCSQCFSNKSKTIKN